MKPLIMIAVLMLTVIAPADAHHSFAAQFDRERPVTLLGVVKRVDWVNPHVYFYAEVVDEDGRVTEWAFETGNVNNLVRRGWTRDSLQVGERVTVEGFRARDGTSLANAQRILREDGSEVFGASGNYPVERPQ